MEAFLRAQSPEVVCLQEFIADDIDRLSQPLGYGHRFYVPMCRFPEPEGPRTCGLGILSRRPFAATEDIWYAGGGSGLDELDRSTEESRFATNRYAVAVAAIGAGDGMLTIGTTHFPWTNNARTADFQRTACDGLLHALKDRPLVLCGDFNAPRGKEIFTRLAGHWTDNIPPTYTTSLDPVLHRAGPLPYMVDGVFSTGDYGVSEVRLHQGVSDHCAITCTIAKGCNPSKPW